MRTAAKAPTRYIAFMVCALSLFGCGDDDDPSGGDNHAGHDAGSAGDGGSSARSVLERPGSLPRPPGRGLPDELRPPR